MGTVVLNGATSGSTTLTPVDAVTATITLPSATGTLATLGANTFTGKITATAAGIDVPTSALGTCYSGTYTPAITNATNTTQTTAIQCRYTRVGNLVTVYGKSNPAVNGAG